MMDADTKMTETINKNGDPWDDIRAELCAASEAGYRDFTRRLTPGAANVLGVRMPVIRRMVKRIVKDDAARAALLAVPSRLSHEELIVEALLRAGGTVSYNEYVAGLEAFMDAITNWAVCDSFAMSISVAPADGERFFRRLLKWLKNDKPWQVRAGLVTLLCRYCEAAYIPRILDACAALRRDEYYVQMGEAWLLSTCYVKHRDLVSPWLDSDPCPIPQDVLKRTRQKIRESRRSPKGESL
jgi:3-methyladenine DNA glycosylase AlkD